MQHTLENICYEIRI